MINSMAELMKRTIRKAQADTRVAMPARILSYDAGSRLARVQILQPELTEDGQTVAQPVITDVPVFMPVGGGAAVTFPVGAGDDGIVWFADQDIGAWAADGNPIPDSGRRHSLSDAMFMPAQGRGAASADNLVISFGGASIVIAPSGVVTITAAAGVVIDGDVTVNGTIDATGDVTGAGVSLESHTHGGGPVPD